MWTADPKQTNCNYDERTMTNTITKESRSQRNSVVNEWCSASGLDFTPLSLNFVKRARKRAKRKRQEKQTVLVQVHALNNFRPAWRNARAGGGGGGGGVPRENMAHQAVHQGWVAECGPSHRDGSVGGAGLRPRPTSTTPL